MNSFSILISDNPIDKITLPETVKSFKQYLSENNHIIWEDKEIKNFIHLNFDKEVLDAYNTLTAYAYKADLASYCILSKIGGWYSAITNEIVIKFPDKLDKKLIIFRDIQKNSKTSWAVACQLIYSEKNNPVFDIAINKILENVRNKNYGATPLCVTGPSVFGQAVAAVGDIKSYHIGDFQDGEEKVFKLNNGDIFAKYKKLPSGVIGIEGTNNYNDLWNNKNVYGEKN